MDFDRIAHPLRLAKGSRQSGSGNGCAMNVKSSINRGRGARRVGIVGMAVLAVMALGADPVANADPTDFFAAVQGAGVTGVGPALLENGYNVCWELWDQHSPAPQVAAGLQKDYPTLTTDQAAHFVIAAYQNLCPVPGAYDYWAYSTS